MRRGRDMPRRLAARGYMMQCVGVETLLLGHKRKGAEPHLAHRHSSAGRDAGQNVCTLGHHGLGGPARAQSNLGRKNR